MNKKKILIWMAVAVVLAPFIVYAVPQVVGGSHSYVVRSGSMEPAIQVGSVVIIQPVKPSHVEKDDIITFEDEEVSEEEGSEHTNRVTHRVVKIRKNSEKLEFKTKGEANEDPDPGWVKEDQLVGKVMFSVPKLGYVLNWTGSKYGYFLLFLIPAALIVINEAWKIRKELEKENTKKKVSDK